MNGKSFTRRFSVACLIFTASLFNCQQSSDSDRLRDELPVRFKGDAQIEVGGPFAGIELHHGSPLLNRVSFFYPVANSLDLSKDYWTRDTSRVLDLRLRIGEKPWETIGLEPFQFELTPYALDFHREDSEKLIDIGYRFCKDKPAMVMTIRVVNRSDVKKRFQLGTNLALSLRTSHTYRLKSKASVQVDEPRGAIYATFADHEAGYAQVFVANAGDPPNMSMGRALSWGPLLGRGMIQDSTSSVSADPASIFLYDKILSPVDSIHVVQIIGSCKEDEGEALVSQLVRTYRDETQAYREWLIAKSDKMVVKTGDTILDHTAAWAKAILLANAHYLDGEIVPMPCPAEYNFYFAHDALVTDLAATLFDTARVKRDLMFIVQHARADSVIPHAYYWKDDRYVTEYAGSDNWNHFWFILVAASYVRHSGDVEATKHLFPCLTKSLKLIKRNIIDGLMWASHPDWWDIGHNRGPRAYMTILAIRALRDFAYICTKLETQTWDLSSVTNLAARMQSRLSTQLWDEEYGYLFNFNANNKKDKHYFIGSLLAAHFGVLDRNKIAILMQTAKDKLLDSELGIYNVFPMDLHLLQEYYHFNGNEAGAPGFYANGGIWPHGNAWYALGLISLGRIAEARNFMKKIMSVAGVMHTRNGQPAMYEYRVADDRDPAVKGKVDKPQFLWAAGWYLYDLYHLLGVRENEWNISLDIRSSHIPNARFDLFASGQKLEVSVEGEGDYVRALRYDGEPYAATVLPEEIPGRNVVVVRGRPELPHLQSATAILHSAEFNRATNRLTCRLSAFPSHESEITLVSPTRPETVMLNGKELAQHCSVEQIDNVHLCRLKIKHRATIDTLTIEFKTPNS